MKNTIVISAFPCCGKSTATESLKDFYSFADSDSSLFSWEDKEKGLRNPDFPKNYIEHIKSLMGEKDVVFVSTHKEVREALEKEDIPYVLVYPENSPENKLLWTNRMKHRGNDEKFISFIVDNWDAMIDDMAIESYPLHYILGSDPSENCINANSLEEIMSCALSYFYGVEV